MSRACPDRLGSKPHIGLSSVRWSGIDVVGVQLTAYSNGGVIMRRLVMFLLATAYVVQPHLARAQGLTGALIGTVKDAQGGVLASAVVRVSSPALIGGSAW